MEFFSSAISRQQVPLVSDSSASAGTRPVNGVSADAAMARHGWPPRSRCRSGFWLIRLCAATLGLAGLAYCISGAGPVQAAPAGTIVVDDGFDTSPCPLGSYSLRCAITYANANPGTSIRFAPGLPAVLLNSPLPTITADFTWIDGHDIINNGCYCPRIDGKFMSGSNGLTINASYVTISNINIVNIQNGADIAISGGKDIEISYAFLGILPAATDCLGPSQAPYGIEVVGDRAGSDGNDNSVAYVFANTISCHRAAGVEVVNSNYVNVGMKRDGSASGNYIGTTSDGSSRAGNDLAGVRLSGNSTKIYIGGNRLAHNGIGVSILDGTAITVFDNTLSANTYYGLFSSAGSTQSIIGNRVGTTVDGLQPWPNSHEGILISGGSGLSLWSNRIAYNGAAGIAVTGNSTHASIRNNDIYGNAGLPIDLGNDGPTPNGSHGSIGPNDWHAYPLVTAASGSLIQGMTCADCSVLIFRASGNPGAPGGGGVYLMTTLANGIGQWSATLLGGLTFGDVTFAGLDSSYDNTSEMSPRRQVLLPLIRR
jgi:hypothetical protein